MEKITLVEIDLDRCSNTYGLAPCTASIPTTGAIKCFNCFATCQDTPNYLTETATTRHSTATAKLPAEIDAIPSISSVDIRPAKLDLGESIGVRASININFKDARYPDTGIEGDKYLTDRPYDPYTQGTYWGKFRSRWPYVQNSDIRLLRGDTDQALGAMETRHFVVESVAGPSSSGSFTIQAKDILKLADGKRAQAPVISDGLLQSSINDTDTAITLLPPGIGSSYPSSGVGQIGGKEIITYTLIGDVATIVRAQFNTTAVSHDDGDRFQLCLEFSGQDPAQIINDLLVDYAGVDSSLIPLAAWLLESATYINRRYTALIPEPEAVTDLINEILQQTASTVWWNDVDKLVEFRVLRPVDTNAATYSDDLIKAGSFSAKDQPRKRVSQVWTYFGQLNPLEDLDDKKNYRSALVTVSSESEQNFGTSAIKQIFSRWIPAFAASHASDLNALILRRYSTPPRMFVFNLHKDQNLISPELGEGYKLESWTIQDPTGAIDSTDIQLVQVRSTDTEYNVMAEEVLLDSSIAPPDPFVRTIVIDSDVADVDLRALAEQQFSVIENMTITIIVSVGVVVYGSSSLGYAMETGLWPATTNLNLINYGSIQGRGGDGGTGGFAKRIGTVVSASNGVDGDDGGTALLLSADLDIDNQGNIYGGGGGGGGGGASFLDTGVVDNGATGGGGGGGARHGSGGDAGELDPANGVGDWNGATGGPGAAATETTGGAGGANSVIGTLIISGAGGAGGDYGLVGTAGDDGEYNSVVVRTGGAGGAIGDSIVQSGGTVTFTTMGDIRGAIV